MTPGFDQTASIYTPDVTDGGFTVLASSVSCRLAHVTTAQNAPADERAEVAHRRRLLWGRDYAMPDPAEILVDGQRWSVQPETVEALRGPNGNVIYQRCAVVKVI